MKHFPNQKQAVPRLAKRATLQATTITAALLALYLPIAKAEPDKVYSARADIEFFATLKLILLRLNS
jgi:hypothetical protein